LIVLDASVLIGHLDGHDPHHEGARALLEMSATESLGASAITLAETLVDPARAGRLDEAQAALLRLGVSELALGNGGPERLAQLRADTGLKLPRLLSVCARTAPSGGGGELRRKPARLSS
jgi:predicted nucleic acid-binding protein